MNTPGEQADLAKTSVSSARENARTNSPGVLDRMIFAALLAVIALVAVPYGTVEPWWQALFECAVFILAALSLIEGFRSGSHSFSSYRIFLPLLAIALFGFLQTIPFGSNGNVPLASGATVWRTLSADPHETRLWVSRMIALVLVGAMLMRYTTSPRRLRALIFLVIGVAVVSAVFGLLRKTMQHDLGFVLPYLRPGLGYGQFINNNHFAFLMVMALGLTLGLSVAGGARRDRLPLYLGVALLLGMSIVLSTSRGGILTMLCQLVFVALLFPTVRPIREAHKSGTRARWFQRLSGSLALRSLLVLSLVVIVSVGIVWVGGDPLLARLEAIPGEVATREVNARWNERRIEIWKSTWRLIKAHPIAGVGMAGYWTAIPQYHDASGEFTPQRAHNDYLELLASGGLIGVLLGLWFVVVLSKAVRKQLRATDRFRRAASFGALVGIVGVAIHSLVDFGLHITINAVLIIVLVVIATVVLPPRHLASIPSK